MSARVLNPMLMTDMSRGGGGLAGGRVIPTKAELAPVRRDLFGPVDHAANRALAERELRAQSRLDAERWGFDFQLGLPRCDARYAWEIVTPNDVVPEPYALRGMPYLRKHAPGTPRKNNNRSKSSTRSGVQIKTAKATETDTGTTTTNTITKMTKIAKITKIVDNHCDCSRSGGEEEDDHVQDNDAIAVVSPRKAEMTPPQELRVPDIGNRSCESTPDHDVEQKILIQSIEDPTTPVLPPNARKQSAITDFMKSRKRSSKGSSPNKKSIVEPPEKISRNAGQIRS